MFDVLVIGGGLAGVTAALTARRAGAKVALASRSWGATALSTGAIDLAYSPALAPSLQTARTVAEHVMDIIAHRPHHPYTVLGLERTVAGLERGYDILAGALRGTDLELPALQLEAENAGLPSALGAVLPAAAALAPHWGVDFGKAGRGVWGVLGLHGDATFDARRVAAGVAHDAAALSGGGVELVPLEVPYPARPPMQLAKSLDDQAELDRLAREIATRAKGLAGLIAPPVLGFERPGAARRRLSEAAGAPVFEALARLPSVPGVRLQRRLDAAVAAAGVALVGEATSPLADGGRVLGVVTSDRLSVRAGAVVLASGRFVAGGVVWEQRCREALFELPIVTELGLLEDDSPIAVVRETPVESHPLMTAGVLVNRRLQPMREGAVAFTNLFAAGMVVGGFASRYALCADGVALATGWWAGHEAAGAERR